MEMKKDAQYIFTGKRRRRRCLNNTPFRRFFGTLVLYKFYGPGKVHENNVFLIDSYSTWIYKEIQLGCHLVSLEQFFELA